MTVEHPAKVNAVINPGREPDDLRIAREALLDRENSGQQQRGIDRRDLAVPAAVAGLCVEPVIEPTALLKRTRIEEAQGVARAFDCAAACNPIAFRGDAKSGEAETRSRDARNVTMTFGQRRTIHPRAIRY